MLVQDCAGSLAYHWEYQTTWKAPRSPEIPVRTEFQKKRRPWTSLEPGEAEKLSHLINLYKE